MTSGEAAGKRAPAVSGIVLAAGAGSRLDAGAARGDALASPKQLLELAGRPLLRWVVEAALGSSLSEVVVVVGHAAERVAGALAALAHEERRLDVAVNPDYARGQSASVAAGLARLAPETRAALFLPADQPLVSSRLIDRLIAAYAGARRDRPIVVPVWRGRRGAPVLFDRAYFAELAALEGDAGGRRLLPRHRSRIVEVEVSDPLELADVDTAADLRRLAEALGARTGAHPPERR